jgi:hypothetical protein
MTVFMDYIAFQFYRPTSLINCWVANVYRKINQAVEKVRVSGERKHEEVNLRKEKAYQYDA